MAKSYRGSQKHILDLLDSGQSGISALNGLLASFDAQITEADVMRPSGTMAPREFYLPQFCTEYCKDLFDFSSIIDWWVPFPWRPPTWDLISTFTANNGGTGILLVEAKAHENEFDWDGKKLKPQSSIGSKKNHAQIVRCLTEANDTLSASINDCFRLSVDSHYQLQIVSPIYGSSPLAESRLSCFTSGSLMIKKLTHPTFVTMNIGSER